MPQATAEVASGLVMMIQAMVAADRSMLATPTRYGNHGRNSSRSNRADRDKGGLHRTGPGEGGHSKMRWGYRMAGAGRSQGADRRCPGGAFSRRTDFPSVRARLDGWGIHPTGDNPRPAPQ